MVPFLMASWVNAHGIDVCSLLLFVVFAGAQYTGDGRVSRIECTERARRDILLVEIGFSPDFLKKTPEIFSLDC